MKTLVNSNNNATTVTTTTQTMAAINAGLQKVLDFLDKKEKTEEDAVAIAEFVCKPLEGRPAVTAFSDAIFDGMYKDGICKTGLEKIEFWKNLITSDTTTRQKINYLGWNLVWSVEEDLEMPHLSIEKMSEEEFSEFILKLATEDKKHFHMVLLGVALDCDMWSKFDGWSFEQLCEAAKTEAHLLDNSELGYSEKSYEDWWEDDEWETNDRPEGWPKDWDTIVKNW